MRFQGGRYIKTVSGVNEVYFIGLFDNVSLEYWSIFHMSPFSDQYDDQGHTLSSCFNVDNGMIIGYDAHCGANVRIPNEIDGSSIIGIGDTVFYNYGLRSVSFPDTVKTIGNNAFSYNQLSSVTLPNDLEVISWGGFSDNQLESLSIPEHVSVIDGDAFKKNKIRHLELPDSLQMIGNGAFVDNAMEGADKFIYNRKYDDVNGKYVSDVSSLNSYAGKDREEVVIPNTVTYIGASAFQHLGISSVVIPEGVVNIDVYAFYNNHLKTISIPSSVKNISALAFSDNYELNEVIFHDGIESIWEYAFYDTAIREVTLPSSIKILKDNSLGSFVSKINVYGKHSFDEFDDIYEGYRDKIAFIND